MYIYMHEFTCLNVKLDSVLITELVHLLPQGEKKNIECKYLWIVFLSWKDWYGSTQPKVFHEWQPLRGSPAHVLTKTFWCVWGRVKSHRIGSHVLGPLFDRRFVAGWAKLLNTAAFAAVLYVEIPLWILSFAAASALVNDLFVRLAITRTVCPLWTKRREVPAWITVCSLHLPSKKKISFLSPLSIEKLNKTVCFLLFAPCSAMSGF